MYQFFDTLTDDSGNALLGATVAVTAYPGGAAAPIYSTNGTVNPIANSTVAADITGQVSFFAPDGAYTLTYAYKGTAYKTRSPVQLLDPMGFVAATDTGAANAYVVAGNAYPAQLYTGLKLEVLAAHANTHASTLTYQGGAAQPLNQSGGSPLAPGMIQGNGLIRIEWDGLQWQLFGSQSQPNYAVTAAETAASVVPTNTAYPMGNILRYGAVSDWNWSTLVGTASAANTTAINNAIKVLKYNGGGMLYVPAGAYSISSALNFANVGAYPYDFGNCPIIMQGEGEGVAFTPGNNDFGGSWIVGLTGNWIVDCTGAQFLQFKDLGFRGTGTGGNGASKSGMLFARSTVVGFAQQHRMLRCTVWVDSAPTYTTVGSIAVANNGAEDFLMEQCWLFADTPLAVTFNNSTDLNLASPYATINVSAGALSSTNMTFRVTTFQALTNYAVRLQGCQSVRFDNCVYGQGGANTTNYAINLVAGSTAGASHCQDIYLGGQIESISVAGTVYPGGAVRFDDPSTQNIDIELYLPNPQSPYVSTGVVAMYNNKINVQHGNSGNYLLSCSAGTQIFGGSLSLYPGDTGPTVNANPAVLGTVIQGANIDVSGNLGFAAGSTYLAIGTAGVTTQQAAGSAITPNAANNATAGAAPSVPTSYLKPDGRVQLAGNFVPNGATTITAGTAIGTLTAAHHPNREIDTTAYIATAGTTTYCRILANGQIILGASIVNSPNYVNLDGISFNLNN
jgi:hypothetical protein